MSDEKSIHILAVKIITLLAEYFCWLPFLGGLIRLRFLRDLCMDEGGSCLGFSDSCTGVHDCELGRGAAGEDSISGRRTCDRNDKTYEICKISKPQL